MNERVYMKLAICLVLQKQPPLNTATSYLINQIARGHVPAVEFLEGWVERRKVQDIFMILKLFQSQIKSSDLVLGACVKETPGNDYTVDNIRELLKITEEPVEIFIEPFNGLVGLRDSIKNALGPQESATKFPDKLLEEYIISLHQKLKIKKS